MFIPTMIMIPSPPRGGKSRPQMPGTVRAVGIFFVVILTIVALGSCVFIVAATSKWTRARDSLSWPTAAGVVVWSNVGSYTRATKGGDRTYCNAQVDYTFEVQGRPHKGSKISLGFPSNEQADAQAVVARYPLGTAAQVHYDPADPSIAVLELGDEGIHILLVGIGFFFLICSILLIRLAVRRMRKRLGALAATAASDVLPTPS